MAAQICWASEALPVQLDGAKRVPVAGSTTGIGLAVATTLAKEGATIIVNGHSQERVGDTIQSFFLCR
jgi:NAD(P)-dependent dehydrogenase (short-subunit alcohol dehydrogenase family)